MSGTHNFQVFDAANVNMTGDADYSTSTARLNGVSNGIADPLLANKTWHQTSIMAAALAQFLANQGISVDDTNLPNLVAALTVVLSTPTGISYADRIAHAMQAAADIGQISYCPPQPTPAPATYAVGNAGNLNGGYHYREVLISGYKNVDGTYFVRGFSPAASRSAADISPSSQQVVITNLPVGTAGCIGRAIYRSAAGGAAGSEQFCGIVWDNTATTYTDNMVDSQLGSGMPAVQGTAIPAVVPTGNTTGTTVPIPTALQVGALPFYDYQVETDGGALIDSDFLFDIGIYKCVKWMNVPKVVDAQGILVCLPYAPFPTSNASGWLRQIYLPINDQKIYKRNHDPGNWSPWSNIADGGNAANVGGYFFSNGNTDPTSLSPGQVYLEWS